MIPQGAFMTINVPDLEPNTVFRSETVLEPNSYTDTIVVGIDGSQASEHALRWAAFLARSTNSTLAALSIWDPVGVYGWTAASWSAVPTDWNPGADADKQLQSTLDKVFGAHRPLALRTAVIEGNVARSMLEVSRGARMLVVGSRGHGGFAGLLLGSVSSACAEHATCPVLVVHGNTPPPPVA
jgi:nucleotide-binding universal stress UspA family protein